MILPSLLLQKYNNLKCRGNIEEEEAEEMVMELLQSASQLANETPRKSFLYHMSNYFLNIPLHDHVESDDSDSKEWMCVFELLQMILIHGNNNNHHHHHQEAPLIQGHLLLRLVQEVVVPLTDECINDGDLSTFQYLCLLLSCEAIHVANRSTRKRWRRFQSMCCETIALFQRFVTALLGALMDQFQDCNTNFITLCDFISIAFYKHFVPAIMDAVSEMSQNELLNTNTMRGIIAGYIHLALLLGRALSVVSTVVNDEDIKNQVQSTMLRLSTSIQEILGHELDLVVLYPHLVHNSTSYGSSLQKGSCLQTLIDHQPSIEEFVPLITKGSESEHTDDFDTFCGMETTWEVISLASLIHKLWQEDSLCISSYLQSEMNRPELFFELFFPLVEIFLSKQELVAECEDSHYRNALQSYYYDLGIDCLSKVLEKEPQIGRCSLLLSFNVMDTILNPIHVMQFLFNRIISLSAIRNQNPNRTDQEAIQDIFKLLQKLLSVYDISHQITIVKELLHRCPFPSLIPKMIDMLRPAIPLMEDNDPICSDFVLIVYEFLEEMTSCTTIDDFSRLLENAEIYSSAVSLLYLAVKLQKITRMEAVGDIYPKLVEFHKTLTSHLNSWVEEDKNTTNQRFRLCLLENSLQMLLD